MQCLWQKPMEVNDGEGPGSEGLEVQDKGVDLRQLLNKRRHNGREQVKGRSGIFGNSLWDEDLG